MSPPKQIHQQGLLATDSLDGDSPGKNETSENVFRVDRMAGAVENEDGQHKSRTCEVVSAKTMTKLGLKPLKNTAETAANYELELVDLPDSTPDCLNKDVEDFNDDHQNSLKSVAKCCSDVTHEQSSSLNKLKPQQCKRNGKRKKQAHVNFRKKTKKQKTIHPGQNECCKAAGGGEKSRKTGNGKNGGITVTTKSCITGTALVNHGCQGGGGGGGGDGGEDGDGREKKPLKQNCSFKTVAPKKKSSTDEMEVVENGVSSERPMDVDPVSSEKQDDDMGDGHRPEEKPSAPDMKPSTRFKDHQKPTPEFFMDWHCRINRHHYCQNGANCGCCRWVRDLFYYHMEEWEHGCDCRICFLKFTILQFHKPKCRIEDCCICTKFMLPVEENVALNVQHVARNEQNIALNLQNVALNLQNVQHDGLNVLNTPTSAASLDTTNAVIYNDDILDGLTHFREHEDFTFKKSVGKGGNGEVHDVVLHEKFKKMYFPLGNKNFVVKKAIVMDDELNALKHMSTHPNFVKTFLVSNRIEGKFSQLTLMEKCDTSLWHYIKQTKGLDLYEAMHFWTQVLDAVVHLHNLRIPIIHKDIKSANVLLTYETNLVRAKLADYDSVKLLRNEYTKPGLRPRGTLHFIAPEVLKKLVHGRPADVYSMGMFLLELLYGKLMKTPQVAIKKLMEIDIELANLIARCLAINPEERPTAVQLKESPAVLEYIHALKYGC